MFKIGDKVVLTRSPDGVWGSTDKDWSGLTGTVVTLRTTHPLGHIGITLNKENKWTHTLNNTLSTKTGIWVSKDMINLVKENNNILDPVLRKIDYLYNKQNYITKTKPKTKVKTKITYRGREAT